MGGDLHQRSGGMGDEYNTMTMLVILWTGTICGVLGFLAGRVL